MHLLERMPAADISLREVARAANVSHNAPYHHFSDRLGLLKAIAERSMAELLAAVTAAVDSARAPRAALIDGGAAYIRFAVEHPHAFDAVYDPTVCVPGAPTATMAPLIDALERVLADGAASVGLDAATDPVSLWSLIHGFGTLAAAGHFTLDEALVAHEAAVSRLLAPVG